MRLRIAIAAMAAAGAGFVGAAYAQDIDLMQFADTNMDGKVTLEEYTAFSEQSWSYFAQDAAKVKVADLDDMAKPAFRGITLDANGEVTKEAYMAGVPDRFKAADKNGDGVLDAAELNATMAPPKDAMTQTTK